MSGTHCQTCGHSLDVIEKKGHGPACWLTPEESASPVPAPAEPAETPDREQAIRERVENATKGPWAAVERYDGGATVAMMRDWNKGQGPAWAAEGLSGWIHSASDEQPARNAEFIAHAREDVPYLLAEVTRLRAEVERLTAEMDKARFDRAVALHALRDAQETAAVLDRSFIESEKARNAAESSLRSDRAALIAKVESLKHDAKVKWVSWYAHGFNDACDVVLSLLREDNV